MKLSIGRKLKIKINKITFIYTDKKKKSFKNI
jgi:hypothetical protein